MGKAKHTQGPWEVKPEECDRPYIRIRGTRHGLRYKIANVPTPVHEGVHPREAEETRANARLIAESPEMLRLLARIIEDLPGKRGWLDPALERAARELIARVENA